MTETFQGTIYKIISAQTTDIYIGSTITSIGLRLSKHKNHYKMYLANKYFYLYSYKVVQFDDATIELVYEGVFRTKADLHRLEGEYIGTMPNVCNKNIAGGAPPLPKAPKEPKESLNTPYVCSVCQGRFTKKNKTAHEETQRHQKAM